ncbi:MAG: DNA mismatch repair protein MutS [Halobacteriales archaeon]
MDAALGAPEELRESEELTPMISQYVEVCERYEDSLVLFHVGDFYKTFCDAAETVARLCELTLITREDSTGEYAAAGIPVENAESYVERLLEAGYRVAVAEQVEDPEQVTGVAERAVTRVITPGTLTEEELLADADNNYVASLAAAEGRYGVAFLDVSTGDFYATGADALGTVEDEIGRFAPAEAIVGPGAPEDPFGTDTVVSTAEEWAFDPGEASERVADYFGPPDAALGSRAEVRACGALLAYAEYTRGGEDGELEYLNHLTRYDPGEYMTLSAVAVESLELFERRSVHGAPDAALVDVIDETASALGSRELRDWLRRPLVDRGVIEDRLDAVEALAGDLRTREALREGLREVYDLERLISKVSRGRANARDLRSLAATLAVVPEIEDALAEVANGERASADRRIGSLSEVRDRLDPLEDVRDLIDRSIVPDPPVEITEGGVIADGYDAELDDLRATEREGKAWIEDLEDRERERTGIDNLRVGHNSVHGYYIEVTEGKLDRVPDDYTRRQTLKNAERFVTPELKAREDEIIRAEGRAEDLEYEIFCEVRESVAAETERVQDLAAALADLDALLSLSAVAAKHDYARPEIAGRGIDIEGGRHPVVERTQESFVPNDTRLGEDATLAVITGPNMSGKSTYMRQVALIQILAQMGSFVPAASARLGIVDRVFTRVGASDDIAGGRSTFMIEMTELADILGDATADSLVLLDEVGRGTSTADGLAIARAITEYLHDEVGALTLFATHHHELTETAADLERATNRHFDATRAGGAVTFDHEISPGAAAASYGIEVARMAGVPDRVVERSRELLEESDSRDETSRGEPGVSESHDGEAETDVPPGLDDELADVDLATTTPLEAFETLADLKERVEDGE